MKPLVVLIASLAYLLPAVLPVGAAPTTLTIQLQQQNGSGETGTATLTQAGADVQVAITLKGAPATAQPVHIHSGTCSTLGGVVYPLTSVVNGSSTTVVKGVSIDQLLSKPNAINVHQSLDNLGKYVACGNIAASSGM